MSHLTFPTLDYERRAMERGFRLIAGADEAGRGPLAGPVVAAAVILPHTIEGNWFDAVRDSKEMKESERDACYDEIIKHALAYAVVEVSAQEIDEVNILQASLLGMKRAVEQLSIKSNYLLVDGKHYPPIDLPGEAIVKGDQKSLSISAASILAKVTRDRVMCQLHEQYPQFGWNVHKGYPTEYHRVAIQLFGASPLHRMTFNGVKGAVPVHPSALFHSLHSQIHTLNTKHSINQFSESLLKYRLQLGEEEFYYLRQTTKYQLADISKNAHKPILTTRQTGNQYEGLAANYLAGKGYQIVLRNYHCTKGEIDIIAETETTLVFVEVKARKGKAFGNPFEAVSKTKIKKLIAAVEHYLYSRHENQSCEKDIRYDVISIFEDKKQAPAITHIEDAFRSDDLN